MVQRLELVGSTSASIGLVVVCITVWIAGTELLKGQVYFEIVPTSTLQSTPRIIPNQLPHQLRCQPRLPAPAIVVLYFI